MASTTEGSFGEEATCSICLEYFQDPVITECGHNSCRPCLAKCWEELEGEEIACPQCREKVRRKLIPNRPLANFVELTKKLRQRKEKSSKGKGRVCAKHREPLKLFCKDDEAPVCVVCDRSKEHRDHQVVPLGEAAQDYQNQITKHLDRLKVERKKIMKFKEETEKESHDLLKQSTAEMEKMKAGFRKLHQFLEEQVQLLVAQIEEVKKEISRKRDEHLVKLSKELSSLGGLIQEMEEKCRQLLGELLQDVGSILQRDEKKETFENPVVFLPELKWKIWDFCDLNPFLEGVMKQFKDTLLGGLRLQKANITLDPDTAHVDLIVSEDCKSVTFGSQPQDLLDNPTRFAKSWIVLGKERFTDERHFWEVVVESEEDWVVGITRESVKRKDFVDWNPKGGILAIGKWAGGYWAANQPMSGWSPGDDLKRIRISLNCAAGQVVFYNADTAAHLYTYSEASFAGKTILPLFHVFEKGYIRISS